MRRVNLKKQHKKIDRTLLAVTLTLTIVGLIAVADASAPTGLSAFSDRFYFVKQQALWGLLGIVLMFIVSKIHYSFWEKVSIPVFVASIVALLLVLVPSLGTKVLGARRWLNLGALSFQPSEFVKLGLALYLAKAVSSKSKLVTLFAPLFLTAGLIMLQPDLGTTIIVLGIGLAQIFVSGINLFYFSILPVLIFLAGLPLVLFSPYRRERLTTFLKSTHDPLGASYHIRQIILALGSGGLFGVGLGQSRQKYLFLPESATDSIFAIIAEEVGFLGSLALILAYAVFVFRGLLIAKNAPDKFSQILSIGLVSWIGGQTFINIASMTSLVPLTGVPLPFISYGGSSLTMILIATGILLNISRHATN